MMKANYQIDSQFSVFFLSKIINLLPKMLKLIYKLVVKMRIK